MFNEPIVQNTPIREIRKHICICLFFTKTTKKIINLKQI